MQDSRIMIDNDTIKHLTFITRYTLVNEENTTVKLKGKSPFWTDVSRTQQSVVKTCTITTN